MNTIYFSERSFWDWVGKYKNGCTKKSTTTIFFSRKFEGKFKLCNNKTIISIWCRYLLKISYNKFNNTENSVKIMTRTAIVFASWIKIVLKRQNVIRSNKWVEKNWDLSVPHYGWSIAKTPSQVCNWQGVTQHNRCAIEAPEEIQVTTTLWKLFLLYQLNIIFTCGFLCKGIRLLNLASFPPFFWQVFENFSDYGLVFFNKKPTVNCLIF